MGWMDDWICLTKDVDKWGGCREHDSEPSGFHKMLEISWLAE